LRITQTVRNQISHAWLTEHAVTGERVQVHTRHLPWRASRDRRPLKRPELECCEHLERYVRNLTRIAPLVGLKLTSHVWHRIRRKLTTDEVTEQRFTRSVLWLWVDHLHDVRQRGILAHARLE